MNRIVVFKGDTVETLGPMFYPSIYSLDLWLDYTRRKNFCQTIFTRFLIFLQ